jgi:hypothetical protein
LSIFIKFSVRNAELLARINGRHPLIAGYVEEVHRLYNKATSQWRKSNGAGQWLPEGWTMGLQCRYFRGTDTWEAYAAGAVHSGKSAAVSNMQQRQSAGFLQYSRGIAERVLACVGSKA